MSQNQPITLNAAEFACAKTRAAELLADIKRKYPTLKPRAVLTIPPDQCDLDAPPETILRECPAILSNNLAKSELKHLPPLSKQEASAEREQRANRIREISAGLLYRGDALVELRFGHLDYPKIRELQTDELVDRTRTPVSGASIRIVLGLLLDFR
ncbi:MAG: hypothetical protein J0M04_18585 [Verrucomicrobia bacterium]|nr:hypothetical protein [Verrucomicrobiota bacterium]